MRHVTWFLLAAAASACAASPQAIDGDEALDQAADTAFAGFALEAAGTAPPKTLEVGDATHFTTSANTIARYRVFAAAGSTLEATVSSSATARISMGFFGRLSTSGIPSSPLANGTASIAGRQLTLRRKFTRAGVYELRIGTDRTSTVQLGLRCADGACYQACGTEADSECAFGSSCDLAASRCLASGRRAATACTTDTACGTNAFCRGTYCHVSAPQGAVCTGFVRPEYQERCASGLVCESSSPHIADAGGVCVQRVTINEAKTMPSKLVSLVARATRGAISLETRRLLCTRNACTATNACCNRCSAVLILTDAATGQNIDVSQLTESGSQPAMCSGTNCDYQQHCTAGFEPSGRVRAIGKVLPDGTFGALSVVAY